MSTLVPLALTDPLAHLVKDREKHGLNSLKTKVKGSGPDPREAMRPTVHFRSIVKAAILGSPELKLSKEELCDIIPLRYRYYANIRENGAVSLTKALSKRTLFKPTVLYDAEGSRLPTLWSVVNRDPIDLDRTLPDITQLSSALYWTPEQVPDFELDNGRTIRGYNAESEPSCSSSAPRFTYYPPPSDPRLQLRTVDQDSPRARGSTAARPTRPHLDGSRYWPGQGYGN
ncbi:hypothetical protein JB92DRAFT_3128275 [Gautieria morchelliformis]|nr:hypothetical protein JB92DRAFT_3128275 [Gautieria morchelliformis]